MKRFKSATFGTRGTPNARKTRKLAKVLRLDSADSRRPECSVENARRIAQRPQDPSRDDAPAGLAQPASPFLPEVLRRAGVSDVELGSLQANPAWPELLMLPVRRALFEAGLCIERQVSFPCRNHLLDNEAS